MVEASADMRRTRELINKLIASLKRWAERERIDAEHLKKLHSELVESGLPKETSWNFNPGTKGTWERILGFGQNGGSYLSESGNRASLNAITWERMACIDRAMVSLKIYKEGQDYGDTPSSWNAYLEILISKIEMSTHLSGGIGAQETSALIKGTMPEAAIDSPYARPGTEATRAQYVKPIAELKMRKPSENSSPDSVPILADLRIGSGIVTSKDGQWNLEIQVKRAILQALPVNCQLNEDRYGEKPLSLGHMYFAVDTDKCWQVVSSNDTPLIGQILKMSDELCSLKLRANASDFSFTLNLLAYPGDFSYDLKGGGDAATRDKNKSALQTIFLNSRMPADYGTILLVSRALPQGADDED